MEKMISNRNNWVFVIILILGLQIGIIMAPGVGAGTTVNLILNNVPAG